MADIVIDNCGEVGDGAVSYPGLPEKVGPTSLLAGAFIVNALLCRVVERFLAHGLEPPVLRSANVPGGEAHNRVLEARYKERIKGL